MRAPLKIAEALCACGLLLLGGCGPMSQSSYLAGYDRDISSSTQAIETARDDAQRAAAYSKRGRAYSEKARYSRAFKLISSEEYGRLFGLAIQDHDQAIALDPASAEAYFSRGQAYYDRASLETVVDGVLVVTDAAARKAWFDPAVADFRKAVERDSRYEQAWDMLGLTHETTGELDLAISEYSQEMALNSLGKSRVANAYCLRGDSDQKEKKYDAAVADYEKAIDLGATADDWSCDPYNPLFGLYDKNRRYDQAWEVVHKAQTSRKWVMPELLDRLKKDSGRNN
ncbi:MAG: tetratricopeptide repeat protein [Acidobacteriia bacterium]|nr:tetratricopeptide repeat protein [Terriglobia bacterium]